jgi:MOSC domain-containing protein YiiM
VTTLPQVGITEDRGLLSTVLQHNDLCVGVYGMVVQPGEVRLGDEVRFADA